MIFTDEELKGIDVDISDEWQFPDYKKTEASVMLDVYDYIREKACRFFGVNLEDVNRNGWVDVYATIDVIERIVTSIIWVIVPNDSIVYQEKELVVKVESGMEQHELYNQLVQTNGFEEFIDEAREQMIKEREVV